MPQYSEYSSPVQRLIDDAIVRGTQVANEMLSDMTPDQMMTITLISFVYDQSCVALALALTADENGDPEYASASLRMAMRGRLCDVIRVAT